MIHAVFNMQPFAQQATETQTDDDHNKAFGLQRHLNAKRKGTQTQTFRNRVLCIGADIVQDQP